MKRESNRRKFIKKLSGSALAAMALPNVLQARQYRKISVPDKKYSANDRIRVAAIGMGIMGFNNCDSAIKVPGVELAAVCDLYDGHLVRSKEVYGDHLITTRDYREILDRDDIDAVIVSTPDHWHDHISIDAMNKGKAVYCEKPMVHNIDEAKKVIDTEKKTSSVFQVGSQRVSSILYDKAAELYKSGVIGKLILVETFNDRHSSLGAWQYSIPPDASPRTIDWDRFLGDAPKHPFDPVRFFRWRNYQAYGTGVAGDLFVHLFSGMHVVLNSEGPERVYATGGLRYWKDGRDVPDVMLAALDYPETTNHPAFNLQIRVNFVDGGGGGSLLKLVGSEGTMTISWGTITVRRNKLPENPGYGGWDTLSTFPESVQKEFIKEYNEKYPPRAPKMEEPEELIYETPDGYSDHLAHHKTFFGAMRGEDKIIEDATFGTRAAGPALATNISYFNKRIVQWDPRKGTLIS